MRSSTLRRERRVARRHVKRISVHALPPSGERARDGYTRPLHAHVTSPRACTLHCSLYAREPLVQCSKRHVFVCVLGKLAEK